MKIIGVKNKKYPTVEKKSITGYFYKNHLINFD